MFQRKPDRKQLHGVDANSAFFTSHSKVVTAAPKSPIEVGFADSYSNGSTGVKPRPIRRRTSSNSSAGGAGGFVFFLVLWTVIVLGCGYVYFESVRIPGLREQVRRLEADTAAEIWTDKMGALQTDLKKLQRENGKLSKEKALAEKNAKNANNNNNNNNNNGNDQKAAELQKLLESERQQHQRQLQEEQAKNSQGQVASVIDMQKGIQAISKQALIDKFGPGPHKVEVEVNFPSDKSLDKNWYFTIELASPNDMPHTVYTFLQQVSLKLYDKGGYSFFSNAVHVVQGGPVANHLTPTNAINNLEQTFETSGFGHVLFPEYSSNFPHVRHTLGMSGRPGGPKFYINMIDNSHNHGPGGYMDDGTGDPCFGKITHGLDVVERMHQASGSVSTGEWKDTIGGPVAVKSIKILK